MEVVGLSWIEFKDQTNIEFGLTVSDIGRRQRAEEQVDEYEIPYRNDNLIIHTNTYKPYIRQIELTVKNKEKMKLVNAWLAGRGKLRTSIDRDGYFIADILKGLEVQKLSRLFDRFNVAFKVSPFFYLDSGDIPILITTQSTIFNPGTVYSEPYIKITGSGNVDLTINDTIYSFTEINSYIEIDTELKIVYKDTLNQGDKMTGNFPALIPGANYIEWSGTVTSIEIKPRWREL